MDRREFLAASAVAAVAPMPALASLAQPASREYIELRRYHLLPGTRQRDFNAFVGDVAIPAMVRQFNRARELFNPVMTNAQPPLAVQPA